jgi:catechol 2,3-dioxygenase-like lactoylglutathione lyase family enzyme
MERAIPILPTEDLAIAKAFYVESLGFRVSWEASNDRHSGLLGLERGTIQLTLDSPMSGHGRNACVSLQVDDTDVYYDEWSAKVPGIRVPKNEAWGARTFDLLDPSGNTIFVMGPVTGVGQS